MADEWLSIEQVHMNIDMIEDLLTRFPPGHPEHDFYKGLLAEQYKDLEKALRQQGISTARTDNSHITLSGPHVAHPASPASSSGASRKRVAGRDAVYPESKRPSMNPSPITPNTPTSVNSDPSGYQQTYAGPSRQMPLSNVPAYMPTQAYSGSQDYIEPTYRQRTLPFAPSRPIQATSNVIDLTESNPPTPDPFLELDNAYVDGAPQLTNTYGQAFMTGDEFAEFLATPLPAGTGYDFPSLLNQQPAAADAAYAAFEAFDSPDVPLYVGNADKPWAPRDIEDEYGHGLTYDEEQAVENLLGNVSAHDAEDAPERREQTPAVMCSQLKEYQKIGLTWLIKMETGTNKGGILADGMGLGKTVQAISLICARPSDDPLCKTTLIVAPVALMRQWEKEFERHIHQRHRLRVYIYHGGGKNADFGKLRQYDVVLTTFGILTSEFKQKESRKESMRYLDEQRTGNQRRAKDKLALLGPECMWYRVILDEAQCIKNRQTVGSKAAHDLMATHRLVMTGTPMMNTIDELYPLIRFLKIPPYNDWTRFNQDFGKPLRNSNAHTRKRAMQRVQVLLKSIMLRRQKDSTVDGEIVCKLPAKHLSKEHVEFSRDELEIYRALENKAQIQLNKYIERNTLSANYANVLVLLLRLRQACCHPHLIKDLSQPATENISEDELLSRAQDLHVDVVQRLRCAEDFECPVCYDADLNPTIIIPCGHTVCGECFQKLVDPTRGIRDGREIAGTAKCPHCRGELKASMITDYKHFCRVHAPEKLSEADRSGSEELVDADSDSEDEEEEEADDVDENGDLAGFVVGDDESEDELDQVDDDGQPDQVNDDGQPGPSARLEGKKRGKGKGKGKGKKKGKGKAKPKVTLAQLKKESLRNKAAKEKYLRRLRKTWITSAKIEKTMELVSEIMGKDGEEKILIFSQFTSLLDLLEVPMYERKLRYQRYDGSMSMGDRADAVEKFMDNRSERIMLLSLKAGNAGLNLARASQVILLDPFWNPYVEEQAIDRAHRMPQEREVFVHRVLVPETVEDRICEIQERKREMIDTALDERSSKSLTRLNVRELRFLFGMGREAF